MGVINECNVWWQQKYSMIQIQLNYLFLDNICKNDQTKQKHEKSQVSYSRLERTAPDKKKNHLVSFNGISSFLGYLMSNPVFWVLH